LLAAGFAGIVLLLIITAWFDLTFYEAWLTAAKWARFPFLLSALLPTTSLKKRCLVPSSAKTNGVDWRLPWFKAHLLGALMASVPDSAQRRILMGLLSLYMAVFN